VSAVAASLRPVFLAATGISFLAFAFTWLLREVPLRQSARAEGVGESFASPRGDSSERELERIVGSLMQGEARRRVYDQLIQRSRVEIGAEESWVLGRLGERQPIAEGALAEDLGLPLGQLHGPFEALRRHGYVRDAGGGRVELSEPGREALGVLIAARREQLCSLLDGWKPDDDAELSPVLDRLARALVAEMPLRG
jgi:DNA-binding MarR family transcriptional regulator